MTDICKIGLVHPAGARTNFLRTLSKINGLTQLLQPDPQDVSSKGAAHYRTFSGKVNSLSLFNHAPTQTKPLPSHKGREQ